MRTIAKRFTYENMKYFRVIIIYDLKKLRIHSNCRTITCYIVGIICLITKLMKLYLHYTQIPIADICANIYTYPCIHTEYTNYMCTQNTKMYTFLSNIKINFFLHFDQFNSLNLTFNPVRKKVIVLSSH